MGSAALTRSNPRIIASLAARHRLPTVFQSREFVDAGGFISYGVSFPDLYRRAAVYVDKVLKGAKPADLPGRGADEVRTRGQSEDREGAGLDDPVVAAGEGGSAHRVVKCRIGHSRRHSLDRADRAEGHLTTITPVIPIQPWSAQSNG